MDLRYLKLLMLLICSLGILTHSQAQDNSLKIHGLSIGPGIASSSSTTAKSGASLNFDISTIVNKHILSVYFNSGIDLNAGGFDEDFTEFNLTYGRKWLVAKDLYFEGHIGFGLFSYNIDDGAASILFDLPDSTIGFPIRAKLLFYPVKRFGIGINPNFNINSIENAYSANFIFQYNFD